MSSLKQPFSAIGAGGEGYVLGRRIARGGMAEIFLGKYGGTGSGGNRIFAVKKILPHYAQEREYIEMFRSEAKVGKVLQHPNIVQVYDFRRFDDSYALIMEFVDGSDLRALLAACEKQRSRLNTPMALYIACETLRGLHYAHNRVDESSGNKLGIVHRDMSPQNILVGYASEIKIIDFGIAKFDAKNQETKPGVVKGKYSYMSPEQVTAKEVDYRTDIFSLAVVLWEVLAMKRLFAGQSEVETIKNVMSCNIAKSLQELNPTVDSQLEQIVLKGLAKQPEDRFQSAQEFQLTLGNYLREKYPDFLADDLGQFIRQVFADRRKESEQYVKELMGSTEKPLIGIESFGFRKTLTKNPPKEPTNSPRVVADAAHPSKLQPLELAQRPYASVYSRSAATASRRNETRNDATAQPNSNQRPNSYARARHKSLHQFKLEPGFLDYLSIHFWKISAVLVCVLALAMAFLLKSSGSSSGGAKGFLLVDIEQESAVIELDGEPVWKGNYVSMPAKLSIKPGSYSLTIKRENFQSQSFRVQISAGKSTSVPVKSLQRQNKEKLALVRINSGGNTNEYIEIENGLFRGKSPVQAELSFNRTFQAMIFPNHPKRKGSVPCKFTLPDAPTSSLRPLFELEFYRGADGKIQGCRPAR